MDIAHGFHYPDRKYLGIIFKRMERGKPQSSYHIGGRNYNDDRICAYRGVWEFD
jgi:hypothetical protein